MATDVGHAHYRWPHEDPTSTNDPQEASVAQIVDHGSISLGRYAVESLSWEKRSVFTVNRRQEELDKCSAHGLVAQKKAYFEEFYKRIRAAKSSQTDQNNHVTLEGGVSTSCPNAEAKTDVNAKHPGCETIRKYDSHVEKVANCTDISKAVLSDSRENSFAHPELQSSPTKASLPRESSQDVEKSVYIHAIQIEHFSTEPTIYDPLTQSREVIHHVGKDSHEKEAVSGENVSSLSTDELVISAGRPAAITPQVSPRKHKSLQLKISVKGETSQENTNQSKQETASVPKVKKGHAAPRGGTTKVECRNKSSHGSNPIHKQVDKAENGVHSSQTKSDKPLGNDMSSSFSSSKPLTVKRSNVTIPRPFSFATEKRATAPSHLRGNRQKSVSDSLASDSWSRLETTIKVPVSCPSRRLASSLPHAKVFKDVQEPLDKTATVFTAKEAKIEGKRFVGSKGRVVSMLESPETRSLDLPRPKESCRLGGDKKLKISDIKTKEKEEKAHGRLMPEVHPVSSEKTAPIVSGILSKPSQKAFLSRSMNLSADSKKSRSINLSFGGNKPRQEKPHWR